MILSNTEILKAIVNGELKIGSLTGEEDPHLPPFNTTAIDLRIDSEIVIPESRTAAYDLREKGISKFLSAISERRILLSDQPYSLMPSKFILAQTLEQVELPIGPAGKNLNARVEGKSSIARCGVLIHFTAPTIHTGFQGTIALEIVNIGVMPFLLYPGMYICQLLLERVSGEVAPTENQFSGQRSPVGKK